jgi:hypothetical protein
MTPETAATSLPTFPEENGRILDEIQEKPCSGRITTVIPRDSRRNLKERETVLQIRYAAFDVKKPQINNLAAEQRGMLLW